MAVPSLLPRNTPVNPAAVLAVNYKKISPIDFSHSNIISVFNAEGELAFQQEGLGVRTMTKYVNKITEEAEKLN